MGEKQLIELGGNITLAGFKELGYGELVVVKKVVGNYARKFSDIAQVNELSVTLKPVHKTSEESSKHELKTKLDLNGKIYTSEIVEFNLFVGLDKALKRIETQVTK